MFPTLVLGPQRSRAASSSVKTEISARLDLWRRGHLDKLALRAKAQGRARPLHQRSKTTRAAMRDARLIHKQQFARVTNLDGSLSIADATKDALKSLRHLFSLPNGVSEEVLLDYYGPAAPPNYDKSAVCVSLDTLRACLAAALPLSSPHKDRWRVEHLSSLEADLACG